jgi:hypothetical protein
VSQIVEAYVWQPSSLEQWLEGTARKVAGINRGPGRRGKHEPIVTPQPGELSGLVELAVVMAPDSVYSSSGGRVTGADFSPAMLAVARTGVPGEAPVEWYQASAEELPFSC